MNLYFTDDKPDEAAPDQRPDEKTLSTRHFYRLILPSGMDEQIPGEQIIFLEVRKS